MRAILALDQGTTSSRAIVFGPEGEVLGTAQQEHAQLYPRPGWVEHDANEIWRRQQAVAEQALAASRLTPGELAGIGVTNQRETVVLWDRRTGQPVANAIVWQDRRTAAVCDRLRAEGHATIIRARTGLEVDAYFSATKIAWLLDAMPDGRARAANGDLAVGTIDSWLLWQLTAGRVHATDATNASRTMLYDIHTGDWDAGLLDLFGIPRALLPRIVDSSGVAGETTRLAAGQRCGVPISGIAGDQQAALYGQGCFAPGSAKCTYGTGCFILANTGATAVTSAHRLLTTVAWQRAGVRTYALEGSVFAGGSVVQWLRDGLGLIPHAAAVEELAASVPDTGGVWLVPAFSGLGAPYWDGHARGTLLGLTGGSTRAHIARASLAAIALQVCDVAGAMAADAGREFHELRVDGGACANNLLMQMQADYLGVAVQRPRYVESTALGAARLAGEGVGLWPIGADLPAASAPDRRFTPTLAAARRSALRRDWARAVERSRDWAREEPEATASELSDTPDSPSPARPS